MRLVLKVLITRLPKFLQCIIKKGLANQVTNPFQLKMNQLKQNSLFLKSKLQPAVNSKRMSGSQSGRNAGYGISFV